MCIIDCEPAKPSADLDMIIGNHYYQPRHLPKSSPSRRKASTADNNPSPQQQMRTNVELDLFPLIRSAVEPPQSPGAT